MARRSRRRQKGAGEVLQPAPGVWAIRWREGVRRRYRSGFADRETAEKVLAKVRGEIALARAGMPSDSRGLPTLSELGNEWVENRKGTHRAWRDDQSRWKCHVRPFFGRCTASKVDSALLRRFVADRLTAGLHATTVGLCVRFLSTMFSDFAEEPRVTGVSMNPVRALPRSTRRLYRAAHDWKKTPYLKPLGEVVRVYAALREAGHEQTAVAFAVGAFAMPRTGEVLGLSWPDIDLERGEITVQRQVNRSQLGPLKDDESRVVPVQVALAPVLAEWQEKSGGKGFLFGPDRPGRLASARTGAHSTFMRPSTLYAHLYEALNTFTWDDDHRNLATCAAMSSGRRWKVLKVRTSAPSRSSVVG
jgi:integrase